MAKRVMLQIDGGGILGITPSIVLDELEKRLRSHGKKKNFLIRDMLDLCCGTSTGAIISGFIAAGVNAAYIKQFYTVDGIDLFNNSKNPIYTRFISPKFKRQPFIDKLDEILNTYSAYKKNTVTLGDLPDNLMLMTTAYNLSSHRTHFIKSFDSHDKPIQVRDAIAWSALSAAFYYGKINAPTYTWKYMDNSTPPQVNEEVGAVFQDGGQGTQNCTLDYVLTEIFANKSWDISADEFIIISLGTGGYTKFESYEVAKNIMDLGQTIKLFMNQARDESTVVQKLAASYVAKQRTNIQLFRLDYESSKDYRLDDTEHADIYIEGANKIIKSDTFEKLISALTTT